MCVDGKQMGRGRDLLEGSRPRLHLLCPPALRVRILKAQGQYSSHLLLRVESYRFSSFPSLQLQASATRWTVGEGHVDAPATNPTLLCLL